MMEFLLIAPKNVGAMWRGTMTVFGSDYGEIKVSAIYKFSSIFAVIRVTPFLVR